MVDRESIFVLNKDSEVKNLNYYWYLYEGVEFCIGAWRVKNYNFKNIFK
jgi:hypothetical protein